MANISALSSLTTTATALSNLILVTPQAVVGYQPQPKNLVLQVQPALLFHYQGEQAVTLECDITDHFTENNSAIQDQIALKPIIITASGYIGELNDIVPPILAPLKFTADKLTVVSAYVPGLSATAIRAYNQAVFLFSVGKKAYDSAISSWTSIRNGGAQTTISGSGITVAGVQNKQQQMFQQFAAYRDQRTLFTIQTPWAVFTDMAMLSVRAIQDEETRVISNFEVKFKQIRYANTQLTKANGTGSARNAVQAASLVNLGTSTPPVATTTLGGAIQNVTGVTSTLNNLPVLP